MLYLMPIYFIIALIIIVNLMKKYPAKHRVAQFLLLSFLFYLPVGWDVILGRAYFYYLCHKDGGIHIYQTVELGPEYWNKDGSPKFYTEKGDFDEAFFDGRYKYNSVMKDQRFKRRFHVSRHFDNIVDTKSGKLMGENISYLYGNGWVWTTWQPFNVSSQRCPHYNGYPDNPSDYLDNPKVKQTTPYGFRKFDSYIFLRKETENKQGEEQ